MLCHRFRRGSGRIAALVTATAMLSLNAPKASAGTSLAIYNMINGDFNVAFKPWLDPTQGWSAAPGQTYLAGVDSYLFINDIYRFFIFADMQKTCTTLEGQSGWQINWGEVDADEGDWDSERAMNRPLNSDPVQSACIHLQPAQIGCLNVFVVSPYETNPWGLVVLNDPTSLTCVQAGFKTMFEALKAVSPSDPGYKLKSLLQNSAKLTTSIIRLITEIIGTLAAV